MFGTCKCCGRRGLEPQCNRCPPYVLAQYQLTHTEQQNTAVTSIYGHPKGTYLKACKNKKRM